MNEQLELTTGPELVVTMSGTGARGKSAYEAARDAGFSGTEQEFAAGLSQAAGGASVVAFAARADFPAEGREGVLYLDCAENTVYRFSAGENAYRAMGARRPSTLHGGKAGNLP